MSSFIGTSFTTGNSVVNQLPVGAILRVSDNGTLTVEDVPQAAPSFSAPKPGDRFDSKYGPATVVAMTSRLDDVLDVVNGDQDGFLYVADGTNTLRVVTE